MNILSVFLRRNFHVWAAITDEAICINSFGLLTSLKRRKSKNQEGGGLFIKLITDDMLYVKLSRNSS